MPTKTIYINRNDISIFDTAKKKAGDSLSSVIVSALNEYLGRQTLKDNGFRQVSIRIGEDHEQCFMGKRLVGVYDKDSYKCYKIYETPKGQYAVVTRNIEWLIVATANGSRDLKHQAAELKSNPEEAFMLRDRINDWNNDDTDEDDVECELKVYRNLDDLNDSLPKRVREYLSRKLENYRCFVEYLDI